MNPASTDEVLREVFIGRQPILDRRQVTVGYKLLFRATAEDHASVDSAKAATADVVCKAFAELGLAAALGSTRAFISVDADFLGEDAVEVLPTDRVVLELAAEALLDTDLLARCQMLHEAGYEFCLTCTPATDLAQLPAGLASYFKVVVGGMERSAIEPLATALLARKTPMIAARIETGDHKALADALGFQLSQGYYYARPAVIEGRKLDASQQGLLKLIKIVGGDADEAAIDAAFRTEPALVLNLLRLTNSVGIGARTPVSSVRHAVALLGRRQLQRWLQLLMFSQSGGQDIGSNPLMQHAALRGRFMELLAASHLGPKSGMGDSAFITGMMSLMPAALGMRIETLLEQISVGPEVHQALATGDGPLGPLLVLTVRFDDNDMAGTAAAMARLGGSIDHATLNQCLSDSLAWALQIGRD